MRRLALALVVTLLPVTTAAQTTPIIRIDHQATVLSGTTYAVAHGALLGSSHNMGVDPDGNQGPDNGTNLWDFEHHGDGSGWNGRNFMRYFRWGGVDGDPDAGFTFNPTTVAPAGGWVALAEAGPIYARWRIRTNDPLTEGVNSSAQMKWYLFGGTGISGERRMILSFERAEHYLENNCSDETTQQGFYMAAGVSGNRNVFCAPVDEWAHIQIAWCYTGSGVGCPYMRAWVNTNNEASPTAEHTAFTADSMGGVWTVPESWNSGHWGEIVSSNSFSGTDASFDVMDFEIDDEFDDEWFADDDPPGPTHRFRAPNNLRLKAAERALPVDLWVGLSALVGLTCVWGCRG
jgi:hypothetical protein